MNLIGGIIGICIGLILAALPGAADMTLQPVYHAGEEIVVNGSTNFNTDNSVLIEIFPASFGPKGKYEPSMIGGGSCIVPVTAGNDSYYVWSGNFSSTDWAYDTYMVRAEVIGKDYAETKTFELVETEPIASTRPKADARQEQNKSSDSETTLPISPDMNSSSRE